MVVIKVSIQGTLPGGEKWSVNPVFTPISGDPPTQAKLQAVLSALSSVTVPNTLTAIWNANTSLTGWRIESRDQESGELLNLAEGARTGAVAGTGAGNLPYQAAMVQSLRANAVGARGRGRLFWPATGLVLSATTLRANSVVLNSALAGASGYLQGIEVALKAQLGPTPLCVWSRTHFGASAVVETRMGDIVDVQRRRRDALIESYLSAAYVGAP